MIAILQLKNKLIPPITSFKYIGNTKHQHSWRSLVLLPHSSFFPSHSLLHRTSQHQIQKWTCLKAWPLASWVAPLYQYTLTHGSQERRNQIHPLRRTDTGPGVQGTSFLRNTFSPRHIALILNLKLREGMRLVPYGDLIRKRRMVVRMWNIFELIKLLCIQILMITLWIVILQLPSWRGLLVWNRSILMMERIHPTMSRIRGTCGLLVSLFTT